MNQEAYDSLSEDMHERSELLYNKIMAIPMCQPQYKDDECVGFISRIADAHFVASIFTESDEFTVEFSTAEDYMHLDEKILAYDDAKRYAEYVIENETDENFIWSIER